LFTLLTNLVWSIARKFSADSCPQLAASITYYVIFSMFPFLIFLAGAVGLFLDESLQDDVIDQVLDGLPFSQDEGRSEVEAAVDAISGANGRVLGLVGLAGLMWTSSSMFNSVRRALNIVYREPHYARPWVPQKLIDLGLVLALGAFFLASVVAMAALQVIRARSEDLAWLGDLQQDLGFLWRLAEYAVPAAFSLLGFVALYTIVPSRRRRPGDALVGAIVATVLFQLATVLFGFYVANFGNFDLIFGSLGALAAFMFWIYVSSQIMLLGAEVTAVLAQVKEPGARQARFQEFGRPLHHEAWRAVRSLFVRESPPDDSPRE
jgi:membrane protein